MTDMEFKQHRRETIVPEEFVMDILRRLPIGAWFVRFHCVCKSWRDLLSDVPSFISQNYNNLFFSSAAAKGSEFRPQTMVRHTSHRESHYYIFQSPDSTLEALLSDRKEADASKLPSHPFVGSDGDILHTTSIAGCCNGVFCLSGDYSRHSRGLPDLVLWNPATSETKLVPRPSDPFYISCSVLAFGFGFDPETKDYTIVRKLERTKPHREHLVEVYSLRKDSWKRSYIYTLRLPERVGRRAPLCFKGKLYWADSGSWFYSFDLSKEVLKETKVAAPRKGCYTVRFPLMVSDQGSLLGFVHNHGANFDISPPTPEIWALLEFGVSESWIKLFVFSNIPSVDGVIRSAELWKNSECFFMTKGGDYRGGNKLIVFHPETREMCEIELKREDYEVITYVPSRISLRDYHISS